MSPGTTLTRRAPNPGAGSYELGDEIRQIAIDGAIAQDAEEVAGAELFADPSEVGREQLYRRVIEDMTTALVTSGDTYPAADGVHHSLVSGPLTAISTGGSHERV